MEILIQLNKTEGTTIVMVTHDEHMAKKTHRLVRLFDGRRLFETYNLLLTTYNFYLCLKIILK